MARTHFVCWRKRSEPLHNQDREVFLLRPSNSCALPACPSSTLAEKGSGLEMISSAIDAPASHKPAFQRASPLSPTVAHPSLASDPGAWELSPTSACPDTQRLRRRRTYSGWTYRIQ